MQWFRLVSYMLHGHMGRPDNQPLRASHTNAQTDAKRYDSDSVIYMSQFGSNENVMLKKG